MDGRESLGTVYGASISLMIVALTLSFATVKFDSLMHKRNPTVSRYTDQIAIGKDKAIYPGEDDDFMIAFALENAKTGELYSDPRYVK